MKIKKIEDGKEKVKFMQELAERYLDFIEWQILFQPSQNLYWLYDDANNKWVKRTADVKDKSIVSLYVELFNFVRLNGLYENTYTNSARLTQEVLKIEALLISKGDKYIAFNFPPDRYFNLKNGIFDTKTLTLIPHNGDPKYWTTTNFSFSLLEEDIESFDIKKQKGTMVYKFLKGAIEFDKELLLMVKQMFGILVSPYRYPVMYIMTGPQGTAKSTTIQIASLLTGNNYSVTNLESFATDNADKFALVSAVVGKKLNMSEEIQDSKIQSKVLKTIITEPEVEVRAMYSEPKKYPINTRFLGTSNEVLQFSSLEGIQRRIKYIPLHRQIPSKEIDIQLLSKIKNNPQEVKLVFLLALQGLKLIQDNMKLENNNWLAGFYQSEKALQEQEESMEATRPVHSFLREIDFQRDNNSAIALKPFYEIYKVWAEEAGHSGSSNISLKVFYNHIKEYMRFKFGMTIEEAKNAKHKLPRSISKDRVTGIDNFVVDSEVVDLISSFENVLIKKTP